MKKLLARLVKVSPAMVVAMLALFVALTGTAVATTSVLITGKQIRNGSITGADVKNKSLTARDIRGRLRGARGPAGPRGVAGVSGATGAQGAQGAQGLQGPAGTAVAYARVQADGTLQPDVAGLPSQAKGLQATDIVKGEAAAATGTYCFGDLGFLPASAVVSLDNADAAAANRNLIVSVSIFRGQELGDCPPGHEQARVRIVDGNTEAATDARFFIWFE